MSKKEKTKKQGKSAVDTMQSILAVSAILISLVISILLFKFVLGNPINFKGGNPAGEPLPGNLMAMMYKGGFVVPFLLTLIFVLLIYTIERFITLGKAKGKGKTNVFVNKIREHLSANQIDDAVATCDKQRGSLANIMRAGLVKYKELKDDPSLEKEEKILALQKELEESSALELPMLSRNLVFLSTIASISVLGGLFGTVLGMIRAFKALAQAGAPDALALASGISEALINTAFGIGGSLLAIILYNLFSTRIDNMTFKIDEASFSLIQTAATQIKD